MSGLSPNTTGKRGRSWKKFQQGITLLEVLISLVILAMILLALTAFMDIIQEENWYNYRFTVASFLSQSKIEELTNRNFTATVLDDTAGNWTPDPAESLTATGVASGSGYYSRQWRIDEDNPAADMKLIEVRTQWVDRQSKTHEVELEGVVTED